MRGLPTILVLLSLLTACSNSSDPQPLTEPPTSLGTLTFPTGTYLRSDQGDWIGQGIETTLSPTDAPLTVRNTPSIIGIEITHGSWIMGFAAPDQRQLKPGLYENATRLPFRDPSEPGLNISGPGRGCNVLSGSFEVLDSEFGANDELTRFAVDFTQHCERGIPALVGSVRVNSPIPVGTKARLPEGVASGWAADGDPLDAIGRGNGVLRNGVEFSPGVVRQAFQFDGKDDFIEITDTSDIDFGVGDFTIELWANFDSLSKSQSLIHKVSGKVPEDQAYLLMWSGEEQSLHFVIREGRSNENPLLVPLSLIPDRWYHLAVARSGNTSMMFVDGMLVGSRTADTIEIDTGSGGIAMIGKRALDGEALTQSFNGRLDEITVYSRALSPMEIELLYTLGKTGRSKFN